ncbi:MAG: aminodeoxychorismate lyase [Elusimicrobiales bacterium]|nr:aminodeoxychorismate lyase [Elusimicrobiales bacterium]
MKLMLNGELLEEDKLKISVNDHGLLYGVGLFETFRVYNGTPFLFKEHMKRLQEGIDFLGINLKIEKKQMLSQLNRLLEINQINNAYIRLTVTGGKAPLGLPSGKYDHPSVLWHIKSIEPFQEEAPEGKSAVFLKTKRNTSETNTRLKSLNFLNNVLAKQEIMHLKKTEGIFLSQKGNIAEGIVSNIFFVKQEKVYTPSLDTGILNGITRQHVLLLCKQNDIPIEEGLYLPTDLIDADEIFFTNSIQEITPIRNLDGRKLDYRIDGITNTLISLYKKSIKEVIKKNHNVHILHIDNKEKASKCEGISLPMGKQTLVMGILNVTPDSFSDGGSFNSIAKAIERAKKLVECGADIIDIGGESTRPGHQSVSLNEELKRVIPLIEKLSQKIKVPISIDTYKAEVARKAIEAGAHIINDVWGFKRDHNMAGVAAELNVPVVLMHNRTNTSYKSLMGDIIADLRESVDIALKAGVKPGKIILDPGIGFAKDLQDNLTVMNRLEEIVALGYPVLLGTSRKSMIGSTLDLPVTERVEGTSATVALGISKGCKIIRVHDVKEIKRVCKMMDAMMHPELIRD